MADIVTVLVEAAIVITVFEAAALAAYHRATGRGIALHAYGLNLLSGLMLMVALRFGLSERPAYWPIVFLTGAGLAHGLDMWRRWSAR